MKKDTKVDYAPIIFQKLNSYSESLSRLLAIHGHRSINPLIYQIKVLLEKLTNKTNIGHVSTNNGLFGNETADGLERQPPHTNQ